MGKQIFSNSGFTWDIYGDLRNEDPMGIIDYIRRGVIRLGGAEPSPQPADQDRASFHSNRAPAFGTYFYPQTWVGELPAQTPHEILHGRLPAELSTQTDALHTTYKGHKVIVKHDGYITINAEQASNILVHRTSSDL